MAKRERERLADLLWHKAEGLTREAIEADGHIAAKRLEELEHLDRLAKIEERLPSSRRRLPVAAVFVLTLLIVSALLFLRVSRTRIELDLAVSELGFTLAVRQAVTELLRPSELGVDGLRELRLPPSLAPGSGSATRSARSAYLSVSEGGSGSGSITLAPAVFPARTEIRLATGDQSHRLALYLRGGEALPGVTVDGPVQLQVGASRELWDVPTPKTLHLEPGDGEVLLDFAFPRLPRRFFKDRLAVSRLDLSRVEDFTGSEGAPPRAHSTVLAGSLYFESLDDRQLALRPGQFLRFDTLENGVLAVRLHDDRIGLLCRGSVSGLSTGPPGDPRSLMPTTLEWLRARHGLELLWGTTLYLLGLAATLLRWWRSGV